MPATNDRLTNPLPRRRRAIAYGKEPVSMNALPFIFRDARLRRAPQDEELFCREILKPRGEGTAKPCVSGRCFAAPHHEGLTSRHLFQPHPEERPQGRVSRDGPRQECGHNSSFPRQDLPEFCIDIVPQRNRGRRECRVFSHTRSLAWKMEKPHEHSHHRSAETFRHSLHDGLRLIARSPRCAGLVGHLRLADHHRST